MAKILDISKEYDAGLYDRVTGKDCVTEKVVDVTEDCPGTSEKRRVIFLYTRDSRGRIIQMTHSYEGKSFMGSHIHFFIDQLEQEMNMAPRDDTFGTWATKLGLDKAMLRALIEEHAPAA